ncbi:hypothetical protein NliqN6_5311 [Naganishia liquefaciens]|uniref:BHLH domain-containing protein n=1 Tax=Naganishia liquefaciens TaxID=104408 RepID=A0A8H3TZ88_9TREE|nr:hypothetical protein NliqN6_5311 [Naganishia liquefaciens]
MSHATAQKRKAHAALDGLSGSKTSGKKPRVSERGEDSDDDNDDDDDDVDEYIPGSSRSSRGIAASSGSRSKTAKPKIRSAKATKIMSVHESGASSSHATPPLADRKGPHGRPLSREQLRKANHSLIERRRREKMNKAFADLRAMVPGLSTESEGLKGEFKLEVLERSVEHMRHLTQSLSALKNSTSVSVQTPSYDSSGEMSSPDNLMASGYAIAAASGLKRKLVIEEDHAGHSHRTSRQSSVQSRSSDDKSPVEGRNKSAGFATPLIPASRLVAGPMLPGGKSALASPVGSSPHSIGRLARDTTRSPFTRADSQATQPEEGLPAHNSVHPSLQPSSSELVHAITAQIPHVPSDSATSAFGDLPSTFFRSAHQRAERATAVEEPSAYTGLPGGHPMARYRNPDLTLPPPLSTNSPTSPFFRPTFAADPNSENQALGRVAPAEPSPFLPPIMGTPALFDNALPHDRHASRTSVSSSTSGFNLGKDEEAAANVLLALSSPEVMTPWQPASNAVQSFASLDRWSLDQGITAIVHDHSTADEQARSRSASLEISPPAGIKAYARNLRRFETVPLVAPIEKYASKVSASRSSSAPEHPTVAVNASPEETPVTSAIKMRMTAMDFLEGPVSMRFS